VEKDILFRVIRIALEKRALIDASRGKGAPVYVLYTVYFTCPRARDFVDDLKVTTLGNGKYVPVAPHSANIVVFVVELVYNLVGVIVYQISFSVAL